MDLGKLPSFGPVAEFRDRFGGQVKTAADVDDPKPALLSPSPRRAGGDACLFKPTSKADNGGSLGSGFMRMHEGTLSGGADVKTDRLDRAVVAIFRALGSPRRTKREPYSFADLLEALKIA